MNDVINGDFNTNKDILIAKKYSIKKDYEKTKTILGSGINGYVLLWKKKSNQRVYAVKKLKQNRESKNEIRLQWKAIEGCPHIVKIEDLYSYDGFFWVVFEYMAGGRLIDRIKRRTEITEFEVAALMNQICQAVNHLHSLGIAHRDLKPENLLFESNENESILKLGDFGFAKYIEEGLHSKKFTPYYVAPEVLSFSTYNQSCDIWSLGVIMYILCCGEPPFRGRTDSRNFSAGMRERIKRGSFDFDASEWLLVSNDAKELICNMLEVDPAKRFTIRQVMRSNWMKKYLEAPRNRLGSVVKMKSPLNFLNNKYVLKMIFDEMRVDFPPPNVQLKPIAEITDNKLLNKRSARLSSLRPVDTETSTLNCEENDDEITVFDDDDNDNNNTSPYKTRAREEHEKQQPQHQLDFSIITLNQPLTACYYSLLLPHTQLNDISNDI